MMGSASFPDNHTHYLDASYWDEGKYAIPSIADFPTDSEREELQQMSGDAGKAAVHAYIDGFNKRDTSAMADAFNFPHIRLASGQFTTIETREDFLQRQERVKAGLAAEGWHHTVIESLEVVHEGPDKVHLAVEYTRRRADGSAYHRFNSLWIATLQGGHWGIQFRSSFLGSELAQLLGPNPTSVSPAAK